MAHAAKWIWPESSRLVLLARHHRIPIHRPDCPDSPGGHAWLRRRSLFSLSTWLRIFRCLSWRGIAGPPGIAPGSRVLEALLLLQHEPVAPRIGAAPTYTPWTVALRRWSHHVAIRLPAVNRTRSDPIGAGRWRPARQGDLGERAESNRHQVGHIHPCRPLHHAHHSQLGESCTPTSWSQATCAAVEHYQLVLRL
jgi:hypothetical protein